MRSTIAKSTILRRCYTLRIGTCTHEMDFVAFRAQEVFSEFRRVRIPLDEHDGALRWFPSVRHREPWIVGEPFREDTMRVRGAEARLHLPADELELVQMLPRVEPLRPGTALRHHDGVTVFP